LYGDLFNAWKAEKAVGELQRLPKGFYRDASRYIKALKEEARMLDEKTLRASLVSTEMEYAKHLVSDLIRLRERKILMSVAERRPISTDSLTDEEEKLYQGLTDSAEVYDKVLKDVVEGRTPSLEVETAQKPKRILIRFLREIPAIAGIDMKVYGPFKPEDIASIPAENAEMLVKQGVAVRVEI
jgi:DNA replication factor GINS